MAITQDTLETLIKNHLPDAKIDITSLKEGNDYYQVVVSSTTFKGLSRVQQHRLVYQALGDAFDGSLHALSLTTKEIS